MAFLDVGDVLGQTIFGTGSQPFTDPNRVPMSFTSTKRLRTLDPSFESFIKDPSALVFSGETRFNAALSVELPIIEMAVNPHSVKFRQSKRITKRDTQKGSVFFHFSNIRGENNDILYIDFTGNTGNIDPRSDVNRETGTFSTRKGQNTGALKKALIWHNLWNLTREAMLLGDGRKNEFMVVYSSPIINTQVLFIGHFSGVLEWEDNAEKPFTKDYAMTFAVESSAPELNDILQLIQTVVFDPETTATNP